MKKGKYSLVEQIGNFGFYGEIELDCEINNKNEINVFVPDEFINWKVAINFGVIYFMENCIQLNGINVFIKDLSSHPIDTKSIIITYITIYAISNALNVNLKEMPVFDKKNKAFLFPK